MRRTKQDAWETRNNLLDAAEAVFHECGVARASLHQIARRAGVTRGAVYWHFKDKFDLFHAMMERMTLPLEQAAREDMAQHGGHADRDALGHVRHMMRLVLTRVIEDAHTRRVFEVLLLKIEYVGDLMALGERNVAARREFSARMQTHLETAAQQHRVRLRIAAPQAAMALCALFDGLLLHWLMGRDFDLRAVGLQAVDGYLRGLGFGQV